MPHSETKSADVRRAPQGVGGHTLGHPQGAGWQEAGGRAAGRGHGAVHVGWDGDGLHAEGQGVGVVAHRGRLQPGGEGLRQVPAPGAGGRAPDPQRDRVNERRGTAISP